jgi:hypothetical protein
MKTWIIVAMVLGVLVIGGFAIVSAISNSNNAADSTATQTATSSPTCTGCNGGCTGSNNCGRAECGAVSGTETCGCEEIN